MSRPRAIFPAVHLTIFGCPAGRPSEVQQRWVVPDHKAVRHSNSKYEPDGDGGRWMAGAYSQWCWSMFIFDDFVTRQSNEWDGRPLDLLSCSLRNITDSLSAGQPLRYSSSFANDIHGSNHPLRTCFCHENTRSSIWSGPCPFSIPLNSLS